MGEAAKGLSGRWTGIYNYPSLLPPNNFEANIRDVGGVITGIITQPREFFEGTGPPHHAVIDGRREGSSVTFVKFYDDLERATPHYSGEIQGGGNEIAGQWTIPGDWSGTFIMGRASGAEEEAERRVRAEV
jgi:hypothetical protein